MKTHHSMLFLFFAIILGLTACASHARKYPPYQTKMYSQQTSDQARQNVMVADMQLSRNRSYYNRYQASDPLVVEAVQSYDRGNAVINIYQFDVVEIAPGDTEVVYGGTTTVANGDDMVMASDIGGLDAQEARIRYMLADMQLGNVADYYRQFAGDAAIAEAVKRWDAGVRVANIDRFERRIVVQAGWKVLYLGTDDPINGMDVILTSDGSQASSSSGASSASSRVDDLKALCAKNNPMMKPGASWSYSIHGTAQVKTAGAADWITSQIPANTVTVSIDDSMNFSMQWPDRSDGPVELTPEDCTNPPYFYLTYYALNTACTDPATPPVRNGTTLSCGPHSWSDQNSAHTWTDTIAITFDPQIGMTGVDLEHDMLSSDGQVANEHTIWTLTGSNLSPNVPAGSASGGAATCHQYFPAAVGFSWNYTFHMDVTNTTTSSAIQAVTPSGDGYTVEVLSLGGAGARPTDYTCSSGGVFLGSTMLIPAEADLYDGYTFQVEGTIYTVGHETVTVPAGTFDTVKVCGDFIQGTSCDYYAEGIGLVLSRGPEHDKQLTGYHQP